MSQQIRPGGWGKITTRRTSTGTWEASARYCAFNGAARRVRARGGDEREAADALIAKLERIRADEGGDSEVNGTTTVAELAEVFLAERSAAGIGRSSLNGYRSVIRNQIIPVLGHRRLADVRTSTLSKVIQDRAGGGYDPKPLRKVLSGMFATATRHDVYVANPVHNVARVAYEKKPVRILTVDQVDEVRKLVDVDMKRDRPGPKVGNDLRDLVDILLGTGCRIGEAIGLVFHEMDLASERPTVTISGTVKYETGRGVYRQPHPKSKAGWRTIYIPDFVTEILLRRTVENPPNTMGAVFPTRNGTWRQTSGWERMWNRVVDDTDYDWVTFHTFRKSVATLINEHAGTEAAQAQLGHETDQVTKDYYIAKPDMAPDMTEVLTRFAR